MVPTSIVCCLGSAGGRDRNKQSEVSEGLLTIRSIHCCLCPLSVMKWDLLTECSSPGCSVRKATKGGPPLGLWPHSTFLQTPRTLHFTARIITESPRKANFTQWTWDRYESVSVSFKHQRTEMPEKGSFMEHKGQSPGTPTSLTCFQEQLYFPVLKSQLATRQRAASAAKY